MHRDENIAALNAAFVPLGFKLRDAHSDQRAGQAADGSTALTEVTAQLCFSNPLISKHLELLPIFFTNPIRPFFAGAGAEQLGKE